LGGVGHFGVPSPPLVSSLLFSKDLTNTQNHLILRRREVKLYKKI